jgi:hypothetical protein
MNGKNTEIFLHMKGDEEFNIYNGKWNLNETVAIFLKTNSENVQND